jgi:hypothetical protein
VHLACSLLGVSRRSVMAWLKEYREQEEDLETDALFSKTFAESKRGKHSYSEAFEMLTQGETIRDTDDDDVSNDGDGVEGESRVAEIRKWVEKNMHRKGAQNMTAEEFANHVSIHYLGPYIAKVNKKRREEADAGGKAYEEYTGVGERTGRRWLEKLGFFHDTLKKGAYTDGFNRRDVVLALQEYVEKKRQYDERGRDDGGDHCHCARHEPPLPTARDEEEPPARQGQGH